MNALPAKIQEQIDANTAYAIVGGTIVLANLLVIITFLSTSGLYNKYQLLIALAVADVVAGLSTLTAGYGRRQIYAEWPNLPNGTTVMDCVLAPWPPLLAIGGLWPATIVFVIGVERAMAVFTPLSYYAKVNFAHRWILISGALFLLKKICAHTLA
uniref:G-protein coupled receptors family 1 profile domain-containing protein n=1 Tax=Plectus sambesii TaxID=2011161 RepID=A0A914VZN0_9BILA